MNHAHRVLLSLFIIGVILIGGWRVYQHILPSDREKGDDLPSQIRCQQDAKICPDGSFVSRSGEQCTFAPCPEVSAPNNTQTEAVTTLPLEHANERITKKSFGILITPKTSPVQPERFSGYHTGMDFETFPEEADQDVIVRAMCDGTVRVNRFATGYGGLLVTDCLFGDQKVTVVYGHIRLTSVTKQVGETVKRGETIAVLGKGGTEETDGERKHLHLGVHKGEDIDIRGYVTKRSELSEWIDPCTLVACSR